MTAFERGYMDKMAQNPQFNAWHTSLEQYARSPKADLPRLQQMQREYYGAQSQVGTLGHRASMWLGNKLDRNPAPGAPAPTADPVSGLAYRLGAARNSAVTGAAGQLYEGQKTAPTPAAPKPATTVKTSADFTRAHAPMTMDKMAQELPVPPEALAEHDRELALARRRRLMRLMGVGGALGLGMTGAQTGGMLGAVAKDHSVGKGMLVGAGLGSAAGAGLGTLGGLLMSLALDGRQKSAAFTRGYTDKVAQTLGVSPTGKGYARTRGHYIPIPKLDTAHMQKQLAALPQPGVVSGTDYRLPPGTKETAKGINYD